MEIRNKVFMEFYRDETGTLTKLANQNVDTGMGFERMCSLLQGAESVYETDVFWPVIQKGLDLTGSDYQAHKKQWRIVADHLRSATMLIHQGVSSSNEGRGYVLRRIIRRAYYNLRQIDTDWSKHEQIISFAVGYYFERFRITTDLKKVVTSLLAECQSFSKTIAHGQKVFDGLVAQAQGKLSAADIFLLYDTHGFPVELTVELAQSAGLSVDQDGFDKLMEEARERSRASMSSAFSQNIDWAKYLTGITPSKFVGYDNLSYEDSKIIKDFEVDGQRVIILDVTPFYAEGGGQKGDKGMIITDAGEELQVIDTRSYEGVRLHFIK
jgi:alanyl-tRNA synthetase